MMFVHGADIKLIQLLAENTNIVWWNENRKLLNSIIQKYNDWQTIHKFDDWQKNVIKAEIKLQRSNPNNEFSDWRFGILDEMESHIASLEEYEREMLKERRF
jgi:hypothetical protein